MAYNYLLVITNVLLVLANLALPFNFGRKDDVCLFLNIKYRSQILKRLTSCSYVGHVESLNWLQPIKKGRIRECELSTCIWSNQGYLNHWISDTISFKDLNCPERKLKMSYVEITIMSKINSCYRNRSTAAKISLCWIDQTEVESGEASRWNHLKHYFYTTHVLLVKKCDRKH